MSAQVRPAAPPTVLQEILRDTRAELEERKRAAPLAVLEERLRDAGLDGGYGVGGDASDRAAGDQPAEGHQPPEGDQPAEGPAGGDPAKGDRTKGDQPAGEQPGSAAERGLASRFEAALKRPGVGVIAEIKRRAPSAGILRDDARVSEMADAYVRGGASAISVLTERSRFGGSLDDLRDARAASELPLLRKDFIVERYQLLEARLAGADAVLLIVAAITAVELRSLREEAGALGMAALVEVHDRPELERALDAGAELIGINNRDLRDFSVDVGRTFELMGAMPTGLTVVSESGISEAEQLRRLEAAGVDAVLVGAALMRSGDPAAALAGLLAGAQ